MSRQTREGVTCPCTVGAVQIPACHSYPRFSQNPPLLRPNPACQTERRDFDRPTHDALDEATQDSRGPERGDLAYLDRQDRWLYIGHDTPSGLRRANEPRTRTNGVPHVQ